MGAKFDRDSLSRGINFMGIVCPGGQEVGDRKSGDQMGSGPNESQPKGLGLQCRLSGLKASHIFFSIL